jgi:hypothetical protein
MASEDITIAKLQAAKELTLAVLSKVQPRSQAGPEEMGWFAGKVFSAIYQQMADIAVEKE